MATFPHPEVPWSRSHKHGHSSYSGPVPRYRRGHGTAPGTTTLCCHMHDTPRKLIELRIPDLKERSQGTLTRKFTSQLLSIASTSPQFQKPGYPQHSCHKHLVFHGICLPPTDLRDLTTPLFIHRLSQRSRTERILCPSIVLRK